MMSTFAVCETRTTDCIKARTTVPEAGIDLRKEVAPGTLAMSVVHDLRNPLAAIHVAAEMLKDAQFSHDQVRLLARNIYTASVQIRELLQEYIDLCRRTETEPSRCNLRSLVADALDKIASVATAQSVAVVQDIPADLVVTLTRSGIGSVLANLLRNALEATPVGGSICISAIPVEASVVVRVRDTGPGIAPEISGRVFESFVTSRKPNGWGLGLTHARQIVTDHGGEMWVEPASGGGACFAFSLPASMPERHLTVEPMGAA